MTGANQRREPTPSDSAWHAGRWRRGALVCGLAALVTLAGCAQTARTRVGATRPTGPVAWIDTPPPATVPTTTTTTTTTTLAPAPACRPTALRARFEEGGAAAGTLFAQIVVTNVGAVICRVGGHPRLVATMADGTHGLLVAPKQPSGSFPGGGRAPTDLAHGATATLGLATNDACPALNGPGMQAAAHAHTVTSLEVVVPGGAGPPVVVSNLGPLDTACGLLESQLGARIPPQGNPPAPAPGTIGSLHARLRLTAPVHPGKTLSYEVTLTDPGRLPVALGPCPGYTEWVAGKTTTGRWRATKHAYALNCAPVGHIPAGGSATFAMRLRVPPNLTPGLGKLSWALIGYWSVVTGATAHIGP